MSKLPMTPEILELIAERFKALAEPARLAILQALRAGERTVTDLVEETGFNQANVSKHLQLLLHAGIVARTRRGNLACYTIADEDVLALCEFVCGSLAQRHAEVGDLFGAAMS